MQSRSWVLLAALAAIAVGMALAVSFMAPPGWSDLVSLPRFAFAQDAAGTSGQVSPAPSTSATATPLGASGFPRGLDRRGVNMGLFYPSRTGLVGFAGSLAGAVFLLVVGMLCLYVFPLRLARMASGLGGGGRSLARLALMGLAGYVVVAVLVLLAAVSIVGPLAWLLLLVATYLATLLGVVALSLPLGRFLARRLGILEQPPLLDLLAGLLTIFIAGLIPFLGPVLLAVAALLGFGALLQTRAGSDQTWEFDLARVRY